MCVVSVSMSAIVDCTELSERRLEVVLLTRSGCGSKEVGGAVWGWEVEAAVAERTSVQGIGVTASRPLDFLNVLQDHVM